MYGILDSTVPEFIKESLKLREKSSLNLSDGTEPASDLGLSVWKLISFSFFFTWNSAQSRLNSHMELHEKESHKN